MTTVAFAALILAATSVSEPALHHDAEAVRKAREGLEAEIPVAETDPHRPVYHFLPEARWINDPNGAFFADGWYHVFYQHNPYGNTWGHMHWGHARSRDNVFWERLPVANWPCTEKGEDHCYSGSAVQDADGNWQLWYTSVSRPPEGSGLDWTFNGQVMLKPMDSEFIKWGKTTDDPVKQPTLPNNIDGYGWDNYIRDPAFFESEGRTFMLLGITGTEASGGNVAPIYEAKDPGLTQWSYRGTMTDHANDCPQMIPFTSEKGTQWMYVRDGGPPEYFLGSFDPDTAKFTERSKGTLDQGHHYKHISFSTNGEGRHTVYSWISPTDQAKGWRNCFALPRVLTLSEDGWPVQRPVPALEKLRGEHTHASGLTGRRVLDAEGDTVEIKAVFEGVNAGASGLRLRRSRDGKRALEIQYKEGTLGVLGATFPVAPEDDKETISLRIFLDKSIMEVFVNGGKKTLSRVIYPPAEDLGIEAFTDGEASVDIWQMKGIWNKQ